MQIVLLRHGKPDIPEHGRLKAHELRQWIESYNSAGILPENTPSQEAVEIADTCNAVACSDLPRSVESAKALGIEEVDIIKPVFREMGLPFGSLPALKLMPNTWAVLFRILWFIGYSSNSESIHEGRSRASRGADILREVAAADDSVILVGHGLVNRFIAEDLLSNGWSGPENPGKEYWEFGVYEFAF